MYLVLSYLVDVAVDLARLLLSDYSVTTDLSA
jgi:hypothetical protein